jgi:hypothetical protein
MPERLPPRALWVHDGVHFGSVPGFYSPQFLD